MNAGRMMHGLAWAIAALVGCVALAWLVLVVVNRSDEAPSADALRLEARVRDRAPLVDADNGYIHALGLAAAPDADVVAVGRARASYIENYVAPMADGGAHAWPGRDVDYRAARGADVTALVDACTKAQACLDALQAHPDALAQWLDSERWLLERYRGMLATGAWHEAIPSDPAAPMAGLQHALDAQKLHLLDARRQALAGDAMAVRGLLEQDLAFWRQVLASSDLLLSKMVAAAAVTRNFEIGSVALRALPAAGVDAAVPPSWRRPLSVDERSLARALAGEWHYMRAGMRLALEHEVEAAAPWWRLDHQLQRPLYQPQATLNLSAARMVHAGEVSELPHAELGRALEAMARPQEATPRLRAYNTVGELYDQVAAGASYAHYIERVADLEGVRRAALQAVDDGRGS
ncbi:hypothetical protein [Luteimonas padinae]|uniref:DUF885 domain-containing protein n=1 Tax=Luteimonas padinae TaxID=1714359 RepID=A0ABV6SYV7_9GAMM|nr:hypothetical protein [Luteimonas padinae]